MAASFGWLNIKQKFHSFIYLFFFVLKFQKVILFSNLLINFFQKNLFFNKVNTIIQVENLFLLVDQIPVIEWGP